MSLEKIFSISGSAMTAQSQRLNAVASNLANADSVAGSDGQVYRARQVVFEAAPSTAGARGAAGVKVAAVIEDNAPPRRIYDPRHPNADGEGYVSMSNVNVVDEMVNMISASRSYQTNVDVMNTARSLLVKTLSLGN
ncbi:MAG: flagellar basal body rod protein FlgC [Burkholderiales bacterium]